MDRQAKRPTKTTLSEVQRRGVSKKNLTEPTLLEITDQPTSQAVGGKCYHSQIRRARVKTMESIIRVGQRFKFTVLTEAARSERQAVVIRVLSNREEGFGLDVDQYMSYWVEAHELPETESSTALVFVRSTDGRVYLDGKVTEVTLIP